MATPDSLLVHLVEQLQPLGPVTARRMFGASCLFLDGAAMGIVDDGTLYLKVDDTTRPLFAEAGGVPFTYVAAAKGTSIAMSYMTVPESAIDDPRELLQWGRLAAQVARAVAAKKRAKASAKKAPAKKKAATTSRTKAPAKKAARPRA
jgi:DNA transformation protein